MLPDEAAALREAKLVATALRMYRGEAWRVILTNEWGHEVSEAPAPLEASAQGAVAVAGSTSMAWSVHPVEL
jgi:hypothetical protein